MIPEIGRRTLLKAVGVASLAGLSSGTAGGKPGDGERSKPARSDVASRDFEVTIDGYDIGGWTEIDLPSERSTTTDYRDSDGDHTRKLIGSTEYDDLVMRRPLGDMALWNWREDIRQGKLGEGITAMTITVTDGSGTPVAKWEFDKAWPKKYEPPWLDGSGYGDNAVRGQEEVEIRYDSYRRVDPTG